MTPIELKHWQSGLDLSDLAMAHYLGIPLPTWTKWADGTRTLDAAPRRLIQILQVIQTDSPALHVRLIRDARQSAPDQPRRPRGRPARVQAPSDPKIDPEPVLASPEEPSPIPSWLSTASA